MPFLLVKWPISAKPKVNAVIWLRSQTATLTPFGNTVRGGNCPPAKRFRRPCRVCKNAFFFSKLHSCRVRAWCALIQYIYAKLHTTSMMICFAIKQNEKIELQNKRLFSKQVSIIILFCLQAICHNSEAVYAFSLSIFMPPARLVYTKPCVLETWYVLYHEHFAEGILRVHLTAKFLIPHSKGVK